ncbi:SDR family NAD(P)-dependent oxidoreductase [Mycobacterium sp. shizuoka-1]|uniref:SDR family NAD(P)-dependent oxidoreductase n=1 Tax=Mycobacterium sp. shizuoka-1 TaxID=2039281 RepID=UPI000C05EB37|nr:SDR family NAD(P)-dependent oxidoreductase [Mycobacterium sp. shizuoka-1]GAY15802.1 glucose 1-dehydrogenase [Mycobacterium sp. shizuoka-1]
MTKEDKTFQQLLDLTGRVALVTGAGQGVGAATARMLAELGAAVAVNDFYLERAKETVNAIEAAGGRAYAVAADVTAWAAVTAMVAEIERELGTVDILVNNAGNAGATHDALEPPPPFWESTPDDWDRWTAVNLTGVMVATRAVVGGMVERGRGRVITVISEAGRQGEAGLVVYSAAKAGAAGFTRAIAKATAPFGVTANCVALGAVRTPAIEAALAVEKVAAKIVRAYPVGRVGEPSDAAAVISFLASDAAEWITAQTYPVNGGFSVAL